MILQCGHGKCAPSFLPDFGHEKSRITFSVSCLGVPPVGGGLFSFWMGCQFNKPKVVCESINRHLSYSKIHPIIAETIINKMGEIVFFFFREKTLEIKTKIIKIVNEL